MAELHRGLYKCPSHQSSAKWCQIMMCVGICHCLAVLLVSVDIVFITFKTDANSSTTCTVKLFVHIEFSNLEQQEPNNTKLWCAPRFVWTLTGVQMSLGTCHCLATSFIANNFFISVLEIWNTPYYHEFWSISCDFGLVRNAQIRALKWVWEHIIFRCFWWPLPTFTIFIQIIHH